MIPKKNTIAYLLRNKALFLMLFPGTLLLLINNYFPMFGIIIAFKNIDYKLGILKSPWAGFKNFEFLFATTDAFIITRNTLVYNVIFIIVNLIASVTVAIILSELKNKLLSRLYQTSLFFPHFLSMVVVGYILYAFLANKGFVNNYILPFLGIQKIKWYFMPNYWFFILPIVSAWKHVGYFSVIYLAAITGIDNSYYESALIDGASKMQQIRHITLKLIRPQIVIMTLLQVGRIFYSDFGLFYHVTLNTGALYSTTNVIDTYVYRGLLNLGDIGMSSAAGVYQSLVGFLVVLSVNMLVRKVDNENALF